MSVKLQSIRDTYRLYNGVEIPCVGFGTWKMQDGPIALTAVKAAIAAGYRHIDTAADYGNEASVGAAVRGSGIPRGELFVTSKLWNADRGYDATKKAFEATLERMGLDYLDLYLIHWPNPVDFRDRWQRMNAESWRAMEELCEAGRIRAIGVSNFLPHHLEALLETARIKPMVNQMRLCPGDANPETVSFCRDRDILLEAYSPLGSGRAFESGALRETARRYGRSTAQISLRWSLQMGFLPLPKSVTPERIRENSNIFDFELSADDVERMAGFAECCTPPKDPDTVSY